MGDEKGKDEKEKAKVREAAAKDMAKVLDGPLKGEEQIAKIGEIVDAAEGKMDEKEKDEKGKDEKEKDEKGKDEKEKENVVEDVAKVLDLELDEKEKDEKGKDEKEKDEKG